MISKALNISDRLSGCATDSHPNRMIVLFLCASRQFALNLSGAPNRGRRRDKGRHNTVPGVFNLASV